MKRRHLRYIGLAIASALTCQFAISACSPSQTGQTTDQTTLSQSPVPNDAPLVAETAACEPMEAEVPLQQAAETELPFERFDFRPTEVEATETTLTFKGRRYGFTFCKGDRTWGIQSLELAPPAEEDYAEYFEALSAPDYEIITQQDKNYQARVRLEASWLDNQSASDNNLEQVIFELIKPGEREPIAKVLYTNTDIIERELGATAGIPTVTQTLVTDDDLWWSIGFEQGEGASGIATIVRYQVDQDELVLWQPIELGNAQITDIALTKADNQPVLWLGTQYSGEGNPYLPAKGLVAYRPAENRIETYTAENSPLIGAIPTRLWAENSKLWTATASGICEIDWTAIDTDDNWSCWRFTTLANVPTDQVIYPSLLAETPIGQMDSTDPTELLWLADTDISSLEAPARYEIKYTPGLTATLAQGADYYVGPEDNPDDGYFWWPGKDWSWNGTRFVRPWDQVAVNYVGGGPQGIGPDDYENFVADWHTMRGEFELLALTSDTTELKYYSAWIDATGIEPWLTITPVTNESLDITNPTDAVLTDLKKSVK